MKRLSGLAAALKSAVAAGLLMVGVAPAAAQNGDVKARFSMTPVVDPVTHEFDAVDFAISFAGEPDGETIIVLPNDWGGSTALYQRLSHLRVKGATMTGGAEPSKRVLRHRPGAPISLTYRVARGELPGQTASGRLIDEYRAVVTRNFFHVLGTAVVITPESFGNDDKIHVTLGALPEGVGFASDLEHRGQDNVVSMESLYQSISVGGDVRILDAGEGARIAIHGTMEARDDAGWRDAFRRITAAQRAFWRNKPEPYLVTIWITPATGKAQSTGGTELENSFAFFATSNADLDIIDRTLSHEFAHNWVPGRIGGFGKQEGKGSEQYWLSEGFTDFVTMRMMMRADFWDIATFAEAFNAMTTELATSPDLATPNVEAAQKFWTTRSGSRLPYLRGALFAMLVDQKLRAHSDGPVTLDSILIDMQRRASAGADGDAIALLRVSMAAAGVPVDDLIHRHIEQAVPIILDTHGFAPCGLLTPKSLPLWDAGFDHEKLLQGNRQISGVRDGGPAWRSGLRNGMNALGWSVYRDDVTKAIELTVQTGDGRKALSWLPVGDVKASMQSLDLDPNMTAATQRQCAVRLGAMPS